MIVRALVPTALVPTAFIPAALVLLLAGPALAVDHHLVKWKKTGACEIVTRLPRFGSHWIEIAAYLTRKDAERALAQARRQRQCPPAPAKPAAEKTGAAKKAAAKTGTAKKGRPPAS
jgi:hypothetical protein